MTGKNVERYEAQLDHCLHGLRDYPAVSRDVGQADGTVAEARQVIAGVNGLSPLSLNWSSLSQTFCELTLAARAMRELADYLDRNPSALVRGRQ